MKYIRKIIEEDNTIEEMMKQKEISYRRLAKFVGLHPSNVHRAVTGKLIASEKLYQQIKEAIEKY